MIAFSSNAVFTVLEQFFGLIDIEKVIILLVYYIDAICRLIGNALKEPGFGGHSRKYRVEPGIFRYRPHAPPVQMNPDQAAVLMTHPVGHIQDVPADHRSLSCCKYPLPVRFIDNIQDIVADHFLILFSAVPRQHHHAIRKEGGDKLLAFNPVAGNSPGYGIYQMA